MSVSASVLSLCVLPQIALASSLYSVRDLGELNIQPHALNNRGDIIAYGTPPILIANGKIVDLIAANNGVWWRPTAINDLGQIAGFEQVPNVPNPSAGTPLTRAIVWSEGRIQNLGILPASNPLDNWSYPVAINNNGEVIGMSGRQWFLYSGGRMRELSPHFFFGTHDVWPWLSLSDINDKGHIVGSVTDVDGVSVVRGFVYANGVQRELPMNPFAINNSDQIVGNTFGWPSRPAVYENGRITVIGSPAECCGGAVDVNNRGDVVGWVTTSGIPGVGLFPFIYSNGRLRDLNRLIPASSGIQIDDPVSINDNGEILVTGHLQSSSPSYRVFLLVPDASAVPEE